MRVAILFVVLVAVSVALFYISRIPDTANPDGGVEPLSGTAAPTLGSPSGANGGSSAVERVPGVSDNRGEVEIENHPAVRTTMGLQEEKRVVYLPVDGRAISSPTDSASGGSSAAGLGGIHQSGVSNSAAGPQPGDQPFVASDGPLGGLEPKPVTTGNGPRGGNQEVGGLAADGSPVLGGPDLPNSSDISSQPNYRLPDGQVGDPDSDAPGK